MSVPKGRHPLPLAVAVALLLLVGLAIPASAAPTAPAVERSLAADHVDPADCDEVAIDGGGNLVVGGTVVGLATLLLADELIATIQLAAAAGAAADGEACIDLDLLGPGLSPIDADVEVCGTVTLDAQGGATVGGAAVPAALLSADLLAVLEAAAAADADACLFAVVDDDEVTVDAVVTLCLTATLNADGSLTLDVGGSELVLEGAQIIDTSGALEVGAAVEVALAIGASTEITGESTELVVQVVVIEGCGADETAPSIAPSAPPSNPAAPSGAPSAGQTSPPTGGGVSTAAPQASSPAALPDTSTADGGLMGAAVVLTLLLLGSAGGLAVIRVRHDRDR